MQVVETQHTAHSFMFSRSMLMLLMLEVHRMAVLQQQNTTTI